MEFIDLSIQQGAIKASLDRRIAAVLAHGRYIMGPEVAELEHVLAAHTQVKHCVTVGSGTEGLLIALMSLGVGRGDEVITTPFTFVATAEVVALLGAKPVFVDIDPLTCNISIDLLEAQITAATKAIIPVSLYGQPADMDEINAVAKRHGNIPVIEDAAQSFGAHYKGRMSCSLSTIGVTSFFPSKPLGCYGDGGAILTDDDKLARAASEIRVHGQGARYVHTRIGVGGRMDTIQCAIVLAKWERFANEIEARSRIGKEYTRMILERVPGAAEIGAADVGHRLAGLRCLRICEDRSSVFAQYTVLVPDRGAVAAQLKDMGIPTAVHYPIPINLQLAYEQISGGQKTPVATWMADHVLSLPMGPDLGSAQQTKVVEALAVCLG